MLKADKEGQTERLGAPALRLFFGLAKVWHLSDVEQMQLLGIDQTETLKSWKDGRMEGVTSDKIERVSYLLGIFKAANTLLPAQGRADAWMRAPNKAVPFDGRSALELMTNGGISDLQAVRRYLDAQVN